MTLSFGIDMEKYQIVEDESWQQLMQHLIFLGQMKPYPFILEGKTI